jgi:hypothetical protein
MKKLFKLFGIIAFVAIIGFSMAACDDGGGGYNPGGSNSSACPGCGTIGSWTWGSNEGAHWADNCACNWSAPHNFVNGVCVCGRTSGSGGNNPPPSPQNPTTLAQAHSLFLERVGSWNANLFPQSRFTWNSSTATLTYMSRLREFDLTVNIQGDWFDSRKEMEIVFTNNQISSARWRYVISAAGNQITPILGMNPSASNPFRGVWNTNAVNGNGVSGSGIDGVLNTLVHFEGLAINNNYIFGGFQYRVRAIRN